MKKSILLNSEFRYLWGSQLMSQLTINIMTFLVLLRVYEKTNSTIAASFIWVASALPAVIAGPFGAAIADNFNKRKILMITNLAQALLIFLYAFNYQHFFYLSYLVVFGYSFFNQFYTPAEAASLPLLVKKKALPQANGIFFISQQTAILFGIGIAGIASEILGFSTTLLVGSGFLFLAFASASKLPNMKSVKLKKKYRNVKETVLQYVSEVAEGFRFIWTRKEIFYPFFFLMWLHITVTIMFINLPEIGVEIVRIKPSLIGIVAIIPACLGALIGTFVVSKLLSRGLRKRKLIENSLIILAVGFFIFPTLVSILDFWVGRVVVILSFTLAGYAFVGAFIPSLTFLQERIPKDMTGRVFGNFWVATSTLTVLPVIFSAVITEILGIRILMLSIGALGLFALGIMRYYFPVVFEHEV